MALPCSLFLLSSWRCVDTASSAAPAILSFYEIVILAAKIGPFPAVRSLARFLSIPSLSPSPSFLSPASRSSFLPLFSLLLALSLSANGTFSQTNCLYGIISLNTAERERKDECSTSRKGKFGVRVRRQLDSACVIKGPYPEKGKGEREGEREGREGVRGL